MINIALEPTTETCTDFSQKRKIRVLHIDDDAEFLAVAKQCLEEQSQLQVDSATSAEKALEILKTTQYDAVIADYQMPGKNGLELLKTLRQQGNNVPFILLTCKGKEEIAIEALNSGVYRYIDKKGCAETTYNELKQNIHNAVKLHRTEKLLKESENQLRQITENMQDILLLTDTNFTVTYTSTSLKSILGYEPNTLIGKPITHLIHPNDLAKVTENVKKALKNHTVEKMEVHAKHANGHYLLIEGIGKVLTDENNQFIGAVLTCRDTTERKQIEETLKKNEERFRQVSDNAQTWMWEVNSNGLYTYASPVVEKVLGYQPEEIVGKKHFCDLFPPEEREELKKAAFQAFAQKSPFREFLNRNLHKNGSTVWMSTSGIPIMDEKGNLLGYKGADTDVTESKKAEDRVRESEQKYRKLFEEAIDAIFVADFETGIIVDCNLAAAKLVGREKSELIGMHQRFLHPEKENGEKFGRVFEKYRSDKEGQIIEDHIITKSGEVRDVTIKPSLIEVNGKRLIQGIFRDVTESKKTIEKIGFQARLLNAVGQAIVATDTNGTIVFWNQGAEELYGWSKAEALGTNMKDIIVEKIVQESLPETIKRLKTGEPLTRETTLERKDGKLVTVIITITPITDDKGEPIGIIGVSTDISEQKWMREVLEQAIAEVAGLNEKLSVVEGLTRHDIRNKLSALNGRIYLLKKRFNSNIEALEQLREMESASQQILRILEFEKIYIQVGAEELTPIDVETHLNEAASLFSDLKGAKLINECHGLTVLADSLLRQLFYNLIDNTLKYGEKTSTIRVHCVEEANQLKLVYEDDGAGISAETKSKLFSEGYGKGTGYGLFLLKRICEAYGWAITETGKPGQGAQFTIVIPKNRKDGKAGYEIS